MEQRFIQDINRRDEERRKNDQVLLGQLNKIMIANEQLTSRLLRLEQDNSLLRKENQALVEQQKDNLKMVGHVKSILVTHQTEIKELQKSDIPLGFIYEQKPFQPPPTQLWPDLEWVEITKEYAGLFFRVEGKGSGRFGKIQKANTTDIVGLWTECLTHVNYRGTDRDSYKIKQGKWSGGVCGDALYNMAFYKTKGEVRPKNTAIRLWKRVQVNTTPEESKNALNLLD